MASTSLSISGVEINARVKIQEEHAIVSIVAWRGADSSSTTLILGGAEIGAPPPPLDLDLMQAYFQYLDGNRDGKISKAEVKKAFPDSSERDSRDLFARFDRDSDGYLSYVEFVDWVLASATAMQLRFNQPPQGIRSLPIKCNGRAARQTTPHRTMTNILEDDFDNDIRVTDNDSHKTKLIGFMSHAKEDFRDSLPVEDHINSTAPSNVGKRVASSKVFGSTFGRLKTRSQKHATAKPLAAMTPNVPVAEASSVEALAVPLPQKRRARKTKVPVADAQAAEVCHQLSEVFNINVVTPAGALMGKFAVEPTATIRELKAELVSMCNADPWHQRVLHGEVILRDDCRWIDTSIKDADNVMLAIQPAAALEDDTIKKAINAFCLGGESRDAVARLYGHISRWDTTKVTNMSSLFEGRTDEAKRRFNEDLNQWDVTNVTDMSSMFNVATSFNGELNAWNVSNVTNMSSMFLVARVFNGDISNWDVSNVTDMQQMFFDAKSFNGDLSAWSVGNVTDMKCMFNSATSFNADLSAWDVSAVTTIEHMFYEAQSFKGNLSKWSVIKGTNMSSMFSKAAVCNDDVSK